MSAYRVAVLKNTQGHQIERSQPSRGRESSRFAGSTRDTTPAATTPRPVSSVLRRMSQVGMSMRNKAPNGRSRRAERPAEARKRADWCSVRARPASTHEDAPGESPEPPARSSRRPVLVRDVVLQCSLYNCTIVVRDDASNSEVAMTHHHHGMATFSGR